MSRRYLCLCTDSKSHTNYTHQLHALFSSLSRVETKRFKFTGTKHREEFHYYFSEGKFFSHWKFCLPLFWSFHPMLSTFTQYSGGNLKYWSFALRVYLNLRSHISVIIDMEENMCFIIHPGNWNKMISWGVTVSTASLQTLAGNYLFIIYSISSSFILSPPSSQFPQLQTNLFFFHCVSDSGRNPHSFPLTAEAVRFVPQAQGAY